MLIGHHSDRRENEKISQSDFALAEGFQGKYRPSRTGKSTGHMSVVPKNQQQL